MFEDRQLGLVLDLLVRVAQAFVATAGPKCEVTVYDLRTPRHVVHGVAGNLSGLSPGDTDVLTLPTDILDAGTNGLSLPEGPAPVQGIQTSTVWIRDYTGHIGGAVTIKVDFSELEAARSFIEGFLPDMSSSAADFDAAAEGEIAFGHIEAAVEKAVKARRKPIRDFDRNDYISVIRELDQSGLFAVRRSKDIVARELGISRASVYSHLRVSRNTGVLQQ